MQLTANGTTLLIVFVSIILSMSLHEATHAFVSHWLGDTTASDLGRLTLNPLKHIDLMTTLILPMVLILLGIPPFFVAKPVPFNPARVKYDEFGAALIGVSGPVANLALAFLATLVLRLTHQTDGLIAYSLYLFMVVNVGFFIFNMIPWPPLDGSRLLYAFAPEPLQNLMYRIESMGFSSIIIFMFLVVTVLGPFIFRIDQNLINWLASLAT